MTAPDVDALEAARAAATPGPWRVPYPFTKLVDVPGREASITSESAADAALIVAAVNALPDLIAAVRERDALRAAVEGLAEEWDGRFHDRATYTAWEREAYGCAAREAQNLLAAVDGGGQ